MGGKQTDEPLDGAIRNKNEGNDERKKRVHQAL
jgi:hypothetical protein